MSVRRREWVGGVNTPREIQLWIAWWETIGVDLHDVAAPGWVQVDDEHGTVTFLGLLRGDDGQLLIEGVDVVRRPLQVRLEQPAPPFPVRPDDVDPDLVLEYRRRT